MDIRIKMLLLRPFFLVSPCTHVQGNADSYFLLQYTNWLIVLFVLTAGPTLTYAFVILAHFHCGELEQTAT